MNYRSAVCWVLLIISGYYRCIDFNNKFYIIRLHNTARYHCTSIMIYNYNNNNVPNLIIKP